MTMDKDNIYSESLANIADFSFDAQVVDVFTDMIERSVPGYRSIITMIETLTEHYAQPNSTLYDLGCSLGASTLSMRRGIAAEGCKIISVDNSESMMKRCRKTMERDHNPTPVEMVCADIRNVEIADASVVVLNFTLQFLNRDQRQSLINRAKRGCSKIQS